MQYDIFISYARKDNQEGRITELKEHLEQEYKAFSGKPLSCFFDKQEIKSMDDWKHRLLHGLKNSQILLIVLSPSYIESKYCEWEVVEYIKHEYARALQGEGIAQVYFVEIPGIDDESFKESIAWLKRISGRQRIDLQAWKESGMEALKQEDVKMRMTEFQHSLHNRISRIKRIKEAKGNLPRPNPNFIGRQAEMKKLHEALCFGTLGSYAAVHGMGGMGKTSIAFQYAYVYADFYTGGRWRMPCENQSNLNAILRGLDGHLGIFYTDEEKKDDEKAAIRILNELEKRAIKGAEGQDKEPSVLLILDNVDDAQILKLPQYDMVSGKSWLKILVTTRLGKKTLRMRNPDNYITIDELPKEDALSLIESFQAGSRFPNQEEEISAKEIVDLLDGFTLAIEIAATYLGEKQGAVTCADFATLLKREGSLKGIDLVANISEHDIAHEKLISLTLASTVEALSEEERLILNYAALLPPDTIPLPWLRALAGKEYPKLLVDAPIGLEDPWLATINKLLSKRLLQLNNGKEDSNHIVKMHRLLQEVVKAESKNIESLDKQLLNYLEQRSIDLEDTWFFKENQWEVNPLLNYGSYLVYEKRPEMAKILILSFNALESFTDLKHLQNIYKHALDFYLENIPESRLEIAQLLVCNGMLASAMSLYEHSDQFLQRALDIINHLENDNSLLKAKIHFQIGQNNTRIDHLDISEEHLNLAEAILKKSKETDQTLLTNCYAAKVELMVQKSKFEVANRYATSLVQMMKSTYHQYDPRKTHIYQIMARMEFHRQKLEISKKYLLKSLKIYEYCFSKTHPNSAIANSNLAIVEAELGNIQEAVDMLKFAISVFSKNKHSLNDAFLDPYLNLGLYERQLGHLEASIEYLTKAQEVLDYNFDATHTSRIYVAMEFGKTHLKLKEFNKALSKSTYALELAQRNLKPNNPIITQIFDHLGYVYIGLKQLDQAEINIKQAFLLRKDRLPSGYPDLEKSKSEYEQVMISNGRTKEEIEAALLEELKL